MNSPETIAVSLQVIPAINKIFICPGDVAAVLHIFQGWHKYMLAFFNPIVRWVARSPIASLSLLHQLV